MKTQRLLMAAMIGALAMPVVAWSNTGKAHTPAHKAEMQKHRQEAFDEADANHDGQLSPEEFATFQKLMHEKRQAAMFSKADTNKDGEVTLTELDAARAKWRAHHPHHHAAKTAAAK